ncbi:MAG TPA: hypothetical protein VMX12_08955 [Acidimicrobiia bacterium]|nr:hypothetical protein [Acidimicrobiia bacterium]
MQALFVFAYDGSGVPMRILVDLVGDPIPGDGLVVKQLVRPVESLPDWSEYASAADADGNVLVNAASLNPVNSSPRLASFNWLD